MADYKFVSLQQGQSPWIPGTINTVGAYFDLAAGGPGLGNGDTITADQLIPEGGVKVLQVVVMGAPADTNGAPTGTFDLGDNLKDADADERFIKAGTLAETNGGALLQYQNVTPTIANGEYTKGIGYVYSTNQNSNNEQGNVDVVMTVTAAPATAATSGVIYLYVTYACVGMM